MEQEPKTPPSEQSMPHSRRSTACRFRPGRSGLRHPSALWIIGGGLRALPPVILGLVLHISAGLSRLGLELVDLVRQVIDHRLVCRLADVVELVRV